MTVSVTRDALVAMRQQTRNQRHALRQWPVVVASVRDHLDGVIAMLDMRITDLEGEIAAVLAASDWAESLACLMSAPGIGMLTAAWLLVSTMNWFLRIGGEWLWPVGPRIPRRTSREGGAHVVGHPGRHSLCPLVFTAHLASPRMRKSR